MSLIPIYFQVIFACHLPLNAQSSHSCQWVQISSFFACMHVTAIGTIYINDFDTLIWYPLEQWTVKMNEEEKIKTRSSTDMKFMAAINERYVPTFNSFERSNTKLWIRKRKRENRMWKTISMFQTWAPKLWLKIMKL